MNKEKLKLERLEISSFKTKDVERTIGGGAYDSQYPELCDSVMRCRTIHYTACNGEFQCVRY